MCGKRRERGERSAGYAEEDLTGSSIRWRMNDGRAAREEERERKKKRERERKRDEGEKGTAGLRQRGGSEGNAGIGGIGGNFARSGLDVEHSSFGTAGSDDRARQVGRTRRERQARPRWTGGASEGRQQQQTGRPGTDSRPRGKGRKDSPVGRGQAQRETRERELRPCGATSIYCQCHGAELCDGPRRLLVAYLTLRAAGGMRQTHGMRRPAAVGRLSLWR